MIIKHDVVEEGDEHGRHDNCELRCNDPPSQITALQCLSQVEVLVSNVNFWNSIVNEHVNTSELFLVLAVHLLNLRRIAKVGRRERRRRNYRQLAPLINIPLLACTLAC